MDQKKRRRLQAAGWKFGSARDFLELSEAEETLVELKLSLGDTLRQRRAQKRISQTAFARLLGSSQSRVAKMEAGDSSVSFDLQIRALLSLGATRKELAKAMIHGSRTS